MLENESFRISIQVTVMKPVKPASKGDETGITPRGKLSAHSVSARNEVDVKKAFASIERIRRTVKRLPAGMKVKDLIEEGRR